MAEPNTRVSLWYFLALMLIILLAQQYFIIPKTENVN